MRIKLFFAWYDFWIGWFYDRKKQALYICPLPMFGILIEKGSFSLSNALADWLAVILRPAVQMIARPLKLLAVYPPVVRRAASQSVDYYRKANNVYELAKTGYWIHAVSDTGITYCGKATFNLLSHPSVPPEIFAEDRWSCPKCVNSMGSRKETQ